MSYSLTCQSCGATLPMEEVDSECKECGGLLEYVFEEEYLRGVRFTGRMTFWRYRPVLPKVPKPVSLGEGGTPLHRANRLAESLGLENLTLKDETRNPTNSFKDRSASLLISDAVGRGFDSVVCATNGNHGASIAAYSAKVDVACNLIVPKALDIGKLAQMMVYDARIVEVGESIEEAIERSRILVEEMGWYQATTELNPQSIEGLKTISYELIEQEGTPDWVVVAMGSGATLHALWKGFKEMKTMGLIDESPKLIGVQAEGCSPIANAFNQDKDEPIDIGKGVTEAAAIRVAEPIYGRLAIRALRESEGLATSVSDEEMISAGKEIARFEGIFAEPASAATVACLHGLVDDGRVDPGDSVVSLITSSGLKTDDILQSLTKRKKAPVLGSRLATKERILRLIAQNETYGYAIWKGLGQEMTLGAVYQHLKDLEARGLVSSSSRGKRKILGITERGRRVIEALDELQVLL